ncbi:phosphatase PAP2 family protein [Fervidicella metallireducens]|uniref:phosphatase PAP2 family protein n=1 Tax=Fervidicella metallireducens TaxID=655338 RepID=UPI00054D9AE6|nr:phosphatase PAP2 family protein [Fervidicella metallireducens]
MELEIIKYIQSFSNPILDNVFQFITILGEEYFYILFLTITYWFINKKFAYKLGFTFLISGILNCAIKDLFKFKRPIGTNGIRSLRISTATGFSFPSGHTQNAAAFWFFLIKNIKKQWINILGTIMIFSIGLSRLYLGVHWPKDVIAGILLGIASVFITDSLFEYSEINNKPQVFLFILIPAFLGLFFFRSPDYYKAVGISTGFYIGYILESKFINFEINKSLKLNVVKFFIGIIPIILIKIYIKKFLPESILSDLIRYFLIGIYTTTVAPISFKKIH